MPSFNDPMFQPNFGTDFSTGTDAAYAGFGGVNMSPSYMTPSYAANMRPSYGGPQGYDPGRAPNFSMGGAMGALTPSPFQSSSPLYMSTGSYHQQAASDVTSKSGDAMAWAGQNLLLPVAAYAAGNAISGMSMGSYSNAAQNVRGGAAYAWQTVKNAPFGGVDNVTRNAAVNAARGGSASVGGQMGRFVGGAMGRVGGMAAGGLAGIPGGIAGGFAGNPGMAGRFGGMMGGAGRAAFTGARVMGAAGAVAGGLAGAAVGALASPFALAYGGYQAVDKMAFDPYISMRQGQDALSRNSAREYTGGTGSGFGVSRGAAAGVGSRIAADSYRQGMDGSFNAQVLDSGMQAGMYSDLDLSNSDQLVERTKKMSKQIKLLMQIANEPNVVEAINMIGEFKNAGAMGGAVDSLVTQYGAASAISGTASRKIMEGVGKQGQYIAQQNGMQGYVGQMQAASAYAGIANASKSGLVAPSTLAMLGGREGATQSIVAGSTAMMNSTYNKSRAVFGDSGNVMDNVSNMGRQAVGDPYGAMAKMHMFGSESAGMMLEQNPLAHVEGLMQEIQTMPGAKNANGKINPNVVASMLKSKGVDSTTTRAIMAQISNYQDPSAKGRSASARRAQTSQNVRSFQDDVGLDYAGGGFHEISTGYDNMKAGASEMWATPVGILGDISDSLATGASNTKYGSNSTTSIAKMADGRFMKGGGLETSTFGVSRGGKKIIKDLKERIGRDGDLLQEFQSAQKAGGSAITSFLAKNFAGSSESDRLAAVKALKESTVNEGKVMTGDQVNAENLAGIREAITDIDMEGFNTDPMALLTSMVPGGTAISRFLQNGSAAQSRGALEAGMDAYVADDKGGAKTKKLAALLSLSRGKRNAMLKEEGNRDMRRTMFDVNKGKGGILQGMKFEEASDLMMGKNLDVGDNANKYNRLLNAEKGNMNQAGLAYLSSAADTSMDTFAAAMSSGNVGDQAYYADVLKNSNLSSISESEVGRVKDMINSAGLAETKEDRAEQITDAIDTVTKATRDELEKIKKMNQGEATMEFSKAVAKFGDYIGALPNKRQIYMAGG